MSGKMVREAVLRSKNKIQLRDPYGGAQHARLILREHPELGKDVILEIDRGQILCNAYSGCPIRVRFDDGRHRTYSGNEPADHGTETVFLPYSLVTRIAASKRMRVEIPVYENGLQVLEFDVSGFDPSAFKGGGG